MAKYAGPTHDMQGRNARYHGQEFRVRNLDLIHYLILTKLNRSHDLSKTKERISTMWPRFT